MTLAEELHFGRAAARIGVSQSALSQQIQRLEVELDAELIARTSRAASLTSVGELFLEACRRTLAEADRARSAVRDARAGVAGRLVIGCLGAAANGPLPEMIRQMLDEQPRLVVDLRQFLDSAAQERALLAGTLDVGFVRSASSHSELVSRLVLREPFVVFVRSDHHLASRDEIRLADISKEPTVLWPRATNPPYFDLMMERCRAAGFEPIVSAWGSSLESELSLVAAGAGIALHSASNANVIRKGVVAVPVHPADMQAELWMVYRRWDRSVLANRFIEMTTGNPLAP